MSHFDAIGLQDWSRALLPRPCTLGCSQADTEEHRRSESLALCIASILTIVSLIADWPIKYAVFAWIVWLCCFLADLQRRTERAEVWINYLNQTQQDRQQQTVIQQGFNKVSSDLEAIQRRRATEKTQGQAELERRFTQAKASVEQHRREHQQRQQNK